MKTVSLTEAKDHLSALIDEADREHETVRITRHGHGAAILVSEDAWESMRETLFWLSQEGLRDDIAEARESAARHAGASADEVRARYGLLPR
jgi:prevent-host-death family protein